VSVADGTVYLVEWAESGPGSESDVRFKSVCSGLDKGVAYARAQSTPEIKSHCERHGIKAAHVIRETTLDTGGLGRAWYVALDGGLHEDWPY
jgi:hypothetical protein